MNTVESIAGLIVGSLLFVAGAIWLVIRHAQIRIQRLEQTDARVQESEEQFRALFTYAADAIAVHDLETGRFLEVNEEGLRRWGYSLEELRGMTPADLDSPEYAGNVPERLQELSEEGRIVFETVHRCKEGTLIDTEVSARLIQRAGRPVVLVIGRDITERKRIEMAAREVEERFRVAFHTSPDVINIIRLEDGLYVDINEGFTALTGYTRDEVIGKHSLDIDVWCDPADRQRMIEGLVDKGYCENLEARFRNKNGDIGICLMSAKVIMLQGAPHILSITRDITVRKRVEDALQKSEERLRMALSETEHLLAQIQARARQVQDIIDTVPEGVLLLDASGRILTINPVAENILNSLDIDKNQQLKHLGDRALVELLTSPPQGLRHEATAGERLFEIIARPIANGPEPEHWVLVIHEATQERVVRRQLERQERLASVGQLAAGIAHDFNNILASIVLYSQMSLRIPDLSSILRERLTVIVEQAHRAADLINQILDFGRRAILERQLVDLAALLTEQVRLWERTLPETIRITLAYNTDAYLIYADQTRMQQMFMNLVVNARDAMPDGGELRINLARVYLADVEPRGEWVRVDVMDTGTGIPDDVLPHIYDPFFTTKEPGKGSGLGLAQVYGIAVSHDGWIDVKTQVGVGTTFSIFLPAFINPGVAVPMSQPDAMSMGHGETILVVEDSPATRAAIVAALEMLQYCTLEAANGKEALRIVAAHPTEIASVLSDLVMPEMGGKALAIALRQCAPHMRVVVMSGHPLGIEVDALREAGVVAWVQKPPGLQELARALSQALAGSAET